MFVKYNTLPLWIRSVAAFAVFAVATVLLGSQPVAAADPNCEAPPTAYSVQTKVAARVVNPDGSVVGYADNFHFRVTAFNPHPDPNLIDFPVVPIPGNPSYKPALDNAIAYPGLDASQQRRVHDFHVYNNPGNFNTCDITYGGHTEPNVRTFVFAAATLQPDGTQTGHWGTSSWRLDCGYGYENPHYVPGDSSRPLHNSVGFRFEGLGDPDNFHGGSWTGDWELAVANDPSRPETVGFDINNLNATIVLTYQIGGAIAWQKVGPDSVVNDFRVTITNATVPLTGMQHVQRGMAGNITHTVKLEDQNNAAAPYLGILICKQRDGLGPCQTATSGFIQSDQVDITVQWNETIWVFFYFEGGGGGAPPTLACADMSTNPANPSPGRPFDLTAHFTTSGGSGNVPYSIRLTIDGTGVTDQPMTNASPTVSGNGGTGSATRSGIIISDPGRYNGRYIVTVPGVAPLTCPFSDTDDEILVGYRPYLQVMQGDAIVGARFGDEHGNCTGTPPVDTSIKSWVQGATGALGEYLVTALGPIQDFGSGSNTNASNTSMTFAHPNAGGPGNFGDDELCIPDYFEMFDAQGPTELDASNDITNTGVGAPLGSLAGTAPTILKASSTIRINGTAGFNGKLVLLVENGDVFINGNIDFKQSDYNRDSIPYLMVIAKGGNIIVRDEVTRMDGIYINIPDGTGTGGETSTCVNGDATPISVDLRADLCNYRLQVNGAMIAQKFIFKRTHGDVGGGRAPGESAETVNFLPEFFLSNPFVDHLTTGGLGRVQQTRELPPVF